MGGSLVFGPYGVDVQVYKKTLKARRSRHIMNATYCQPKTLPASHGTQDCGARMGRGS